MALTNLARRTTISLNNAHLPAFPVELLGATKLRVLDLFRGIAWDGDPTIPKAIGKLDTLEQLTLGGNSFATLPDTIGKLTELRVLALDYCRPLTALPKTIGRLTELRELALSYTEALTTLPKQIGGLANLESLTLHHGGLTSVPAELWKCTNLRVLTLPESLTKLPKGIAKLTKLETLSLSPAALHSIAGELAKLPALREITMHVTGPAKTLPEELGNVAGLQVLAATFSGIERLPASLAGLANLRELDVSGNKLTTLVDLVRALPKLKQLGYSDNPIPLKEKREIQALMKLPPSKRRAAKPTPAAKPAASAKPESLGTVVSINAYLAMLVADAKLAKLWTGTGSGPEPGGDWARASKVIGKTACTLTVGTGSGCVLDLGIGQGIADVFRVGERITLSEAFRDDENDPLFREWIASEPTKRAKVVGTVTVTSGKVALLPTTYRVADGEGRMVAVANGVWTLLVEPEVEDAWGSGRRAHLILTPP